MNTVYLALGSNMGDRRQYLASALAALDQPDLRKRCESSIHETAPVGMLNQGWFLNMASEFETELFPVQLLRRIKRIERELGRRRTVKNGPRTIDIDILFFGNSIIECAELTVPHPRLRERAFVLAPLAEIAPEFRDPVSRKSITQLLKEL